MKVSEFKDICEALGKFATTREKATGSESKIGVQVAAGFLKFIASSNDAGIVVTVMPHDGAFAYAVDARPFLQSAKALPAKQNMSIEVAGDGLTIIAEGGGRVKMKPSGGLDCFTRKPKSFSGTVGVKKGQFGQISRLFKAISGKIEVPGVRIVGNFAYAIAVAPGNRPSYARIDLGESDAPDGYAASATLEFWDGLRAIESDGTLSFGRNGMLAKSGMVECYSAPYLVSKYDAASGTPLDSHEPAPWPMMDKPSRMSVSATISRRDFITVIKGQAPFDEHNRITMSIDSGTMKVSALGSDAEQSFPVASSGCGTKSVRSDYLAAILSGMEGKECVIEWGEDAPAISVSSKEHEGWTILLAPVSI